MGKIALKAFPTLHTHTHTHTHLCQRTSTDNPDILDKKAINPGKTNSGTKLVYSSPQKPLGTWPIIGPSYLNNTLKPIWFHNYSPRLSAKLNLLKKPTRQFLTHTSKG